MAEIVKHRFLGFLCFAMWVALLATGLWPLDFSPKNQVEWLPNRNGVHFYRYGQIYGTASWNEYDKNSTTSENAPFSMEIWLQSRQQPHNFSAILSIYDPSRSECLMIAQSGWDLVLQARFRDREGHIAMKRIFLDDVLQKNASPFLTVTSGLQGLVIYLDGVGRRSAPNIELTADNFVGKLLVGHTPSGHQPWTGDLLGLAMYNRSLTPEEVSDHYKAWTQGSSGELIQKKRGSAIYLLNERGGSLIHNYGDSGPDLVIPRKFYIVHKSILAYSFRLDRSYLEDILVNILGFVPFGFLISVYLQKTRRFPAAQIVLSTIIVGATTSLAIELSQVYLPSRDSSVLDLIDNVVGTTLGAVLQVRLTTATLFARVDRETSSVGALN